VIESDARRNLDASLRPVVQALLAALPRDDAGTLLLPRRTRLQFRREFGPEPGSVSLAYDEEAVLEDTRFTLRVLELNADDTRFDEQMRAPSSDPTLRATLLVDATGQRIRERSHLGGGSGNCA